MKHRKIAVPLLFVLAALVLVTAACKQKPPVPGPADPEAEEYSAAAKANADMQTAVEEMAELNDPKDLVRPVLGEEGINKALADKANKLIDLRGDVNGEVRIDSGSYADRDLMLNAANASVVCDADLGRITLNALNEDGFTLNGTAKTLYVRGEDLNVTLNNSVEKLYVCAKNAHVTLTGGEFPVVYTNNTTAVIANKTETPVTLILPLGTTMEIPAGKAYSIDSGKLTRAK